jgi:hypothetical protein
VTPVTPHRISPTKAALPTASLQAHLCVPFSPHLLPCCLVDLSSTTAEWPDVQLSFDVGGGRYLDRKMQLALPLDVLRLLTCQWEDCGDVFDELNPFIRHIHEGAPDFSSSLGLASSFRPRAGATLTLNFLNPLQITLARTNPSTPVNGPRARVVASLSLLAPHLSPTSDPIRVRNS